MNEKPHSSLSEPAELDSVLRPYQATSDLENATARWVG